MGVCVINLKQFVLETEIEGGEVTLSGKDYHYLVNVRRLRAGAEFPALLPSGGSVTLLVKEAGAGVLRAFVKSAAESASVNVKNEMPVILFQALTKPAKMDMIIRQAVEGGAMEVVPFFARHSERAHYDDGGGKRTARWERIVREACQQSGSPVPTEVKPALKSTADALSYHRALCGGRKTASLLFTEKQDGAWSLHKALANMDAKTQVALAVGPEGGFSVEEEALFVEAGFTKVNMGRNVLRVETAAVWALASVKMIIMEKDFWQSKE